MRKYSLLCLEKCEIAMDLQLLKTFKTLFQEVDNKDYFKLFLKVRGRLGTDLHFMKTGTVSALGVYGTNVGLLAVTF